MSSVIKKLRSHVLRKARVRTVIKGTMQRPRLSVFVSNQHVHAQIINDEASKTLASSTSVTLNTPGNLTDKAKAVGVDIAKKAKKAKVSKVVFDRGGRKYHGRLKALADAAREGGLEF